MSSSPNPATLTSTANPNFDEHRWVIQIRQTLDEEIEDDNDIPVCIFNVPKALMSSKPEAYTPQQVALGPYHYWHPELYEMGRYKLDAAKRAQKQLQSLKFQHFVERLTKFEPSIRACYYRYIDLNGETLAWMMAIDASFLLEFLQIYAIKEDKSLTRISSRMSHLVDHVGWKSTHNMILRDILMLENQIPLFILRKMLEFQFSSLEIADEILYSMLIGLCNELSPFKAMEDYRSINVTDRAHLLDVLFNMIVPKSEESSEIIEQEDQNEPMDDDKEESFAHSCHVKKLFHEVWKLLSNLNKGPLRHLKQALVSRPVKLVAKLPWKMITRLPGFSILQPIRHFFFYQYKEEIKPEDENSNSTNNFDTPPLMEEITIPSVTELAKSGVRFLPTNGNITTISFDEKTVTLHLPIVSMDVNAEVILRNLVAYEASIASGPLVLTRYTELMNGIVDTEDDAKLLREKGIVMNHFNSDGEVANLWNGMSKSLRLTKVPFLDKVIEDVNKYYNGRWKVKMGKLMKSYVFGSWKLLTFLSAILLFLLMILQAFCSVYRCASIFHDPATD